MKLNKRKIFIECTVYCSRDSEDLVRFEMPKRNKTKQNKKKKKKELWTKEMRQFRISQIANQSQTCPSIGCHCQNKTQTKQEGPISPFLLGTRHVMFWRLSNFDGSYLLSMIQYWSTDRLFLCNLPTGKYEDREIKSKKKMQKEKEEEERKKMEEVLSWIFWSY